MRKVNVWIPDDPYVQNGLLVILVLVEQTSEAIHRGARTAYNLTKCININLSRVKYVYVVDKADKPAMNLRSFSKGYSGHLGVPTSLTTSARGPLFNEKSSEESFLKVLRLLIVCPSCTRTGFSRAAPMTRSQVRSGSLRACILAVVLTRTIFISSSILCILSRLSLPRDGARLHDRDWLVLTWAS